MIGKPQADPLSSSEGGSILRAFLQILQDASLRLTSHPLKAALLSRVAKCGVELPRRPILGYHLDPSGSYMCRRR